MTIRVRGVFSVVWGPLFVDLFQILARDATSGVEFHDSVEAETAAQIAIREIETKYGWSTTSQDFVAAVHG